MPRSPSCLGRHRSTIGRERKRNASVEGRYDAGSAQTLANSRRRVESWMKMTPAERVAFYHGSHE